MKTLGEIKKISTENKIEFKEDNGVFIVDIFGSFSRG